VGDRSRDVELPDADLGGGADPRSRDVEPAGDDLRGGGAAAPRSSDVEPPGD
jgi:hypothetical protein